MVAVGVAFERSGAWVMSHSMSVLVLRFCGPPKNVGEVCVWASLICESKSCYVQALHPI